jgi:hypothetical protein
MLALFQHSDRDKAFEFDIECQSCGFKEPAVISAMSAIRSFYADPFEEKISIRHDENKNNFIFKRWYYLFKQFIQRST